jgi:transposase
MKVTRLGIDIAKTVFQLHGVDQYGKTVLKKRCSRGELLKVIANISPCLIGMESCGSSSYWAREFKSLGHEVKLISPQFVKPYVKSNKNDAADAEAICEAVGRPHMRFVPVKSVESQDIQNLHRIRSRLVRSRNALCNEIRGLLGEYGFIIPKGIIPVRKTLPKILESSGDKLTSLSRECFYHLSRELKDIDETINFYEEKLKAILKNSPMCQRLYTMPGIGPITATAIVSAVSDPFMFKNGRGLSAWLGLVPRQNSSGGKDQLLGISKRGDTYVRSLLIHGARTVLKNAKDKTDRQSVWVNKLAERRGKNRAAVALANKNARAIWVLMTRNEDFKSFAA